MRAAPGCGTRAVWRCDGWRAPKTAVPWGRRLLDRASVLAARAVRRRKGREREGGAAERRGRRCTGWQDSRVVHDSRGPCSERGPFPARYPRGVFPKGDLRGFSDTWRAYPAKASSFWIHGGDMLPRTGDFPVRGPFWDAWSEKIATNCRLRTHQDKILPLPVGRERISRISCHCRTPGNAYRVHFAIGERRGMHQGMILPRLGARAERPHAPTASARSTPWLRPVVYATRHPDAAELRVLQAVRALAVAQPADCRVAAERVVNIAKLVSVPQRRSARHHAPRHHAPQRHDAMRHNAPRCNTTTPCAVRGAFAAAEKVSCGLRVSMR